MDRYPGKLALIVERYRGEKALPDIDKVNNTQEEKIKKTKFSISISILLKKNKLILSKLTIAC